LYTEASLSGREEVICSMEANTPLVAEIVGYRSLGLLSSWQTEFSWFQEKILVAAMH
jgi:hypothetical protein